MLGFAVRVCFPRHEDWNWQRGTDLGFLSDDVNFQKLLGIVSICLKLHDKKSVSLFSVPGRYSDLFMIPLFIK